MYLISMSEFGDDVTHIIVAKDIWDWVNDDDVDAPFPQRLIDAIEKEEGGEFQPPSMYGDFMNERANYVSFVAEEIGGTVCNFNTKELLAAIKKHNIDIIDTYEGIYC